MDLNIGGNITEISFFFYLLKTTATWKYHGELWRILQNITVERPLAGAVCLESYNKTLRRRYLLREGIENTFASLSAMFYSYFIIPNLWD